MKQIIALIPLLLTLTVSAQSRRQTEADKLYNHYRFTEAIDLYEQLLSDDDGNKRHATQRIADAYRLMGMYKESEEWYGKLMKFQPVEPVYYLHYARALSSSKKYSEAVPWFQKYAEARPEDPRSPYFMKYSMEEVQKLLDGDGMFSIFPMEVNTAYDEFGTTFFGTKVIFVSNRTTDPLMQKRYAWDQQPYLDLYVADRDDRGQLLDANRLEGLNTAHHEGPVALTKDLQRIYFTANPHQGKRLVKGSNETTHLMIYGSYRSFNESKMGWTKAEPLTFNSPEFSCMHPTLSADGQVMVFSSDMAGGYGGMDLYRVELGSTGWGVPVNLGPQINSPGDEVFPFLAASGELYFASNGWPGLGGLDVFVALADGKRFTRTRNLGSPVNQETDDFAFCLDPGGRFGYLSSNRPNGKGRDDLYFVQVNGKPAELPEEEVPVTETFKQLEVYVYERTNNRGIGGAVVNVFDAKGKLIHAMQVNDSGYFHMDFGEKFIGDLRFIASFGDFSPRREVVDMEKLFAQERSLVSLPLSRDLGRELDLNPIYFDYNKDNIRPDAARELDKVVAIMKSNPSLVIEVGSHTDSRGRDEYNRDLAERRAASSVAYIISKGIDRSRISGRGYGETQLTNQCEDGVSCTEAEHQLNRRTEFRIVSGTLNQGTK